MAKSMNTTGKRQAEAGRPPFTFDNMPNSFREWNADDMQEGNRALAWFLREAACGLAQRFAEQDAPNHGGDELAVRGMELAFNLLIDRMDVLAGQSPMPYLKDVPGRGEGVEVPDGWKDGRTLRMASAD